MTEQVHMTPEEMTKAIAGFRNEYGSIVVDDSLSYQTCMTFVSIIKEKKKWVEDYWAPEIDQANALHKSLCAKKKQMLGMLDPLESELTTKGLTWRRQEEQRRRDEELRLQAEARKKQEEEARVQAELLKKSGRADEAKIVIEKAKDAPPVVTVASEVPKVEGLSFAKTWAYRLVNPSQIKTEFLLPDSVKIGKMVRAMGKDAEKMIGGIEVYQEETARRSR